MTPKKAFEIADGRTDKKFNLKKQDFKKLESLSLKNKAYKIGKTTNVEAFTTTELGAELPKKKARNNKKR